MPHFKDFLDPNFLSNIDFIDANGNYTPKIVTIKGVKKETVHSGKGTSELVATVHTAETKPFVLSKKNLKTIIRTTRKVNTDDWNNVRIELYIEVNVKAFGSLHDVIRVKSQLPSPAKIKDYTQTAETLRSCTSLESLQATYTALTAEEKTATVAVKDEMKLKLSAQ